MLKITDVEAIHLRLPKIEDAADGTQDCLIVRVQTDAGIAGLGEVVSCSYVGKAVIEAPRSAPFRHGLAAIVTGMDALDLDAIHNAMIQGVSWYGPGGVARHAMSGVDMALWDIRGKVEGKPIRRLLREDAADAVPVYASVLWPKRPEWVRESAERFTAQGYRAVKYGWAPMGPDADLDEALVAAARAALGRDVALMVDAGRTWDAETALGRVARFEKYDVFWLEEPLHPFDVRGYAEVSTRSSIPIAAGEAMTLVGEYADLLRDGKLHFVQPDLGRVGGVTGALAIERLANEAGARAVPHAYGTGVLLAASAQWAAASDQPLTEYTRAPSPLARNLAQHGMAFRDGALHLTDEPGLGVALDEDVVAEFRV